MKTLMIALMFVSAGTLTYTNFIRKTVVHENIQEVEVENVTTEVRKRTAMQREIVKFRKILQETNNYIDSPEHININPSRSDIIEEVPYNQPDWIYNLPLDPSKKTLYFVGMNFKAKTYNEAYELAKKEGLQNVILYVGTKISTYLKREYSTDNFAESRRKFINNIVVRAAKTIRGYKVIDRYFRKMKPKDNTPFISFDLFLLIQIPIDIIKASLEENIKKEELLLRQQQLTEQNKNYQEMLKNMNSQLNTLVEVNRREHDELEKLRRNSWIAQLTMPIYKYTVQANGLYENQLYNNSLNLYLQAQTMLLKLKK